MTLVAFEIAGSEAFGWLVVGVLLLLGILLLGELLTRWPRR